LGLAFGLAAAATVATGADSDKRSGGASAASAGANVVMANDILNRWQPIAVAAGQDAATWRSLFGTQLTQMDAGSLKTLSEVGKSPSASYATFLETFRGVQSQRFAGASKTQLKDLGSPTVDQVFFPIPPCRIVDTRNVGGPIAASTQRAFFFYASAGNASLSWSSQGGGAGTAIVNCPGTSFTSNGGTLGSVAPSAAVATVTAVAPTAAGNFVVWGGDGVFPQSSAINFGAGETLANTTVIPRGSRTGGALDFTVRYNGPSGQADVVVDVVGYFVENGATALDCTNVVVHGTGSNDFAANTIATVSVPACGVGYTRTAVQCHWDGALQVYLQEVTTSFAWCRYQNHNGTTESTSSIGAESRCCRVPGQ